ncbi:hypothetical protein ACFQAT_24585 [Undibacterium arcticum]|uniref:Uncharacterized protein n=1 Tax=Undibacterium arcticum TaxID=1762892 RepID=A0ABV7F7U0_9BURK
MSDAVLVFCRTVDNTLCTVLETAADGAWKGCVMDGVEIIDNMTEINKTILRFLHDLVGVLSAHYRQVWPGLRVADQ